MTLWHVAKQQTAQQKQIKNSSLFLHRKRLNLKIISKCRQLANKYILSPSRRVRFSIATKTIDHGKIYQPGREGRLCFRNTERFWPGRKSAGERYWRRWCRNRSWRTCRQSTVRRSRFEEKFREQSICVAVMKTMIQVCLWKFLWKIPVNNGGVIGSWLVKGTENIIPIFPNIKSPP